MKSILYYILAFVSMWLYFDWNDRWFRAQGGERYPMPDGRPGCWHSAELKERTK